MEAEMLPTSKQIVDVIREAFHFAGLDQSSCYRNSNGTYNKAAFRKYMAQFNGVRCYLPVYPYSTYDPNFNQLTAERFREDRRIASYIENLEASEKPAFIDEALSIFA
jgi:hypothetical protein